MNYITLFTFSLEEVVFTLFLFYFKTSIPQYELYHTFYIFIGRGSLYFSLLKQTKICLQIDIPERRDALQILFGGVRFHQV